MLTRGDKSAAVSLQTGDVIYIPEVGPQIALTGGVKRPGIYELKGETSLAQVLHWAGGFAQGASGRSILVEKAIEHRYQTIAVLPGLEHAWHATVKTKSGNEHWNGCIQIARRVLFSI